MTEGSSPNPADEASKQALELGWNWFKYHAEQRMVMFRYYLVVIGLSVTAFATALKDFPIVSFMIAVFAIIASALFCVLDTRVSTLAKLGENVLRDEQARLAKVLGYSSIQIARLANAPAKHWIGRRIGSYKKAFRVFFASVALLFLLGACFALTKTIGQQAPKSPAHAADSIDL